MKRLYALLLAALAAAACIQDPDAPMNLPDIPVISVDETSVTRVSMLVNGVFGKDMADITAYGVEVSETLFENGGTYQTLAPQEVTGGAFSLGVTGLKSNSTYFLRAFISNGHSKMYSSIITQQTPETSVASVSDVTARDGFLVASIEDNGGRSVEDVGFMWGTSSERKELKREKRYVGTLSEDGKTFTLPLSVVGYGTYYVMAYAEDDKDGTGYSRIPLNVEMQDPSQPNSEIWYTSVNGVVVNPTVKDGFGARIVSNTNEDGKGVIAFDGPVTRIPESAFRQSRLVTVTLPGSVEEVGRYAFDQNGAERTLEAFYGKGASQDHLSLVIGGTLVAVARMNEELDFVIPDGVTKVERGVFEQCHYRSITLPEGLKDTEYGFPSLYHLEAFYGPQTSEDHRCVIIDGELRAVAPEGLTSYVVTDPITGVGNYALYNGFSQIGRLILPESATYIGSQAFGQTQIDTLGLPAHLKEIRDEAFYAMYGLISLTVPEEVETIGSRAFGQAGKDYGGLYNLTFLPTV
ncbi:MAG: leucine-rich repeat protein, partial [Bacteroidales bacterium]|nr:leucine-rich repeat protein [Bacteroidales bacterium]